VNEATTITTGAKDQPIAAKIDCFRFASLITGLIPSVRQGLHARQT
jgi:hypothetical protein